jgi:hypothetical protein
MDIDMDGKIYKAIAARKTVTAIDVSDGLLVFNRSAKKEILQ